MNELKVTGKQMFMSKEIPVVLGGFGEDCRCVTDKTISEIHGMRNTDVRRRISDNIKRFKENVDFIDLKKGVHDTHTLDLTQFGYSKASITQADNIYLLSERGYAKLIKIMDSDLAWEIHDQLIDEYFAMRETIKETKLALSKEQEIQLRMFKAKTRDEVIMLATELNRMQQDTIEKLDNEIDRYSRFLCDKLSTLTKSELATKLDTKPQTIASKFKKLGIYTKTSQVSVDFLRKFPNVKMIIEVQDKYINPRTGLEESKANWTWTGEGAKELVDYLISLNQVKFCENEGFKLVA